MRRSERSRSTHLRRGGFQTHPRGQHIFNCQTANAPPAVASGAVVAVFELLVPSLPRGERCAMRRGWRWRAALDTIVRILTLRKRTTSVEDASPPAHHGGIFRRRPTPIAVLNRPTRRAALLPRTSGLRLPGSAFRTLLESATRKPVLHLGIITYRNFVKRRQARAAALRLG